jgi:hypothetical protein
MVGSFALKASFSRVLEFDLHTLVAGVVIVSNFAPQRLLAGVLADVKDSNARVGEGWAR